MCHTSWWIPIACLVLHCATKLASPTSILIYQQVACWEQVQIAHAGAVAGSSVVEDVIHLKIMRMVSQPLGYIRGYWDFRISKLISLWLNLILTFMTSLGASSLSWVYMTWLYLSSVQRVVSDWLQALRAHSSEVQVLELQLLGWDAWEGPISTIGEESHWNSQGDLPK